MADTKISALTELAQSVIDSANDLLVGVDVSDTTMNATGTNKKLTLKSAVGASIQDLAQTWNDSGTTFTGLKLNVTDTASSSSSLLMDLQIGGSSRFTVRKDGTIYALEGLEVAGAGNPRLVREGNNGLQFIRYSQVFRLLGTGILFTNGTSGISGATRCNQLYFTNSDTVSQLNGTSPQTFNIYNTYTNSTDYERGFMRWNSNVLEIGTEADGAGSARNIQINSAVIGFNGSTSSYPALKQDGTTLKARLADDSGDADFTAASVSASSVDNSSLITGSGYNITGSNSINMVDLSGTWNTTGTPTLIKANVTDTASNANSLVLDLQVDSTSVFSVGKQGEMSLASEENVSSVYVDGYVASGVSAVPMLDLNGTWNTTGTPTLIKADVTDTASGGNSLLIDLQVDSSSVFSVDKGGKISTSGSSDTSSIVANGYSVTGSGETPLMDLSGTWNTTGTPTLIKANITDTASASGSSLMDLQVGGTSKFRVEKDGTVYSNVEFILAASDEISDLSTGTAKVSFRAPFAFDVIDVRGSVGTAPSGSPVIVDINENGSSILSSELFIDSLQKTSLTSASGVVINDGAIADDAEITIDIDQVGSGVSGKGLKITLYGTRT